MTDTYVRMYVYAQDEALNIHTRKHTYVIRHANKSMRMDVRKYTGESQNSLEISEDKD